MGADVLQAAPLSAFILPQHQVLAQEGDRVGLCWVQVVHWRHRVPIVIPFKLFFLLVCNGNVYLSGTRKYMFANSIVSDCEDNLHSFRLWAASPGTNCDTV